MGVGLNGKQAVRDDMIGSLMKVQSSYLCSGRRHLGGNNSAPFSDWRVGTDRRGSGDYHFSQSIATTTSVLSPDRSLNSNLSYEVHL